MGSVRVGVLYRAVAVEDDSDLFRFRIGAHAEQDRPIGRA